MKKIILILVFAFISQKVFADQIYFIAGINENKIDTGVGVTTAKLDEDDKKPFITIGYEISENLGIDLSYFETGEASLTGNNGDRFTVAGTEYQFIVNNAKIEVSSENIALGLRPHIELTKELNLFARLGYHFYEASLSTSGDSITTATLKDDDSSDVFYGIGANYEKNNFFVNAGIEYYELEYDYIDEIKTKFISIGFKKEF